MSEQRVTIEPRNKQKPPRPQTVADAAAGLAAAEKTLKDLQARFERHTARGVELEAARRQASFGAHAERDPAQRKALDGVVDESVRHETEGRAIADAVEEAKRRVAVAQANQAAAGERQRAQRVLEIVAEFRQCGLILDGAARALGVKSHELGRLLQQFRVLQRSATNSPHMTLVPAHVGSPRRKMLQWRFAFFREPSLRFPAR
jgi:hypothetical protein